MDSKSEEGSTASEENTCLSIQYSSLLSFPTPYLCNWDFGDLDKALKYIMKHFNPETIHDSIQSFPNLLKDFVFSNTYMDMHCFMLLQYHINK